MPDTHGFNHLGNEVACIDCDARGPKAKWPAEARAAHQQTHGDRRPYSPPAAHPKPGEQNTETNQTMSNTSTTKPAVSGREAVIAAFRAAGKPLTANEVATVVVDSGVVKGLKGATPKATLGAPIFTGAKTGTVFKRVGSGSPAKFDLRSDAPDSDPQLVAVLKKQITKSLSASTTSAPAKPDPKPRAATKPKRARSSTARKRRRSSV